MKHYCVVEYEREDYSIGTVHGPYPTLAAAEAKADALADACDGPVESVGGPCPPGPYRETWQEVGIGPQTGEVVAVICEIMEMER